MATWGFIPNNYSITKWKLPCRLAGGNSFNCKKTSGCILNCLERPRGYLRYKLCKHPPDDFMGSAASFRSYWITWSSLCYHHHSEKQKWGWTNDHHNLIVNKCVVLQVSQTETPFACLAHTVLKQRQQRWKHSKFDNKTSLITGWHHGTIYI